MARKVAKRKPVAHPVVVEAGARFREAREELSITQSAMAKRAGVYQTTVSRFETGERGVEAQLLLPLLGAGHSVGINLGFVLTGEGPPLLQFVATDAPELVDQLTKIVGLLNERSGLTHAPHQGPAPKRHAK
jgi:transcriptional regulator with XRE-family HTH domain